MELKIVSVTESERGCGIRKEGAYIRMYDAAFGENAEALPIPLATCSCCGGGAVRQMGWQSITVAQLRQRAFLGGRDASQVLPDVSGDEKVALVFIGTEHYTTLEEYMDEANEMGISRRLGNVPTSIKDLSEFYVALAFPVVTKTMAGTLGWEVRNTKPNPKSKTIVQEILINGFAVKGGQATIEKHWAEFQGVIFKIGKARMEWVCSDEGAVHPTRTMLRAANRGITFVHQNKIVGVGGVQTRPRLDGQGWAVYQDGEEISNVNIENVSVDEAAVYKKTKNRNKT
jgi:hypothetical protein